MIIQTDDPEQWFIEVVHWRGRKVTDIETIIRKDLALLLEHYKRQGYLVVQRKRGRPKKLL